MRSAIAIGVALLVAAAACTASPQITTYGNGLDDLASDALLLDDGGIVIVGETIVAVEPDVVRHILLLRLDADGRLLWTQTYGGDRSGSGHGVSADGSGGFVVSGTIRSESGNDSDVYLSCVDSDGNELWTRTFGTPLDEIGGRVTGCESTGYWIVGNSVDPDDVVADPGAAGYAGFAGRSSIYVVRTDGQGRELWSRRIESEVNTIAFSSVSTDDGIVILSGILHYPANDNDIVLTKLSNDGDDVWSRTWTIGSALGYSIISTSDGGYAISGLRSFPGDPALAKSDLLLIKVDANGDETWLATHGAPSLMETGDAVAETMDGGFVTCGWQTPDLFTPGDDILVAGFDRFGALLWADLIPSSAHNLHVRIFSLLGGAHVIVGSARRPGQSFRIQVIRIGPHSADAA